MAEIIIYWRNNRIDKEKRRKLNLILYSIGALISIFAIYAFIFVFDDSMGWKIALIIIGICWLFSAVSGLLNNLKK